MATLLEKSQEILNIKKEKILPGNIKKDTVIFDVTGTLEELKSQEKTVTPTIEEQIIAPDAGNNGLSKVTVSAVTSAIDSNIVAENIKKDIAILGIEGILEAIKQFTTEEEMNSSLGNSEGDLAVVSKVNATYYDEHNMVVGSKYEILLPKKVVLPEAISGNLNGSISTLDSNNKQELYNFSIQETGATITCIDSVGSQNFEVLYTSTDGLTYTTNSEKIIEIYNFKSSIFCNGMKFFFMNLKSNKTLSGLYKYTNENWSEIGENLPILNSGNFNISSSYILFDNMTPLVVQDGWKCPENATFIPQKSDGTLLLDTSKVTNMYRMFYNCGNLTSIPLLDTSSVTSMYRMFYNCSNLTSIPLLDTSNVTNMNRMFRNCNGLSTIPLLDTSKVTNMDNIFASCDKLIAIPKLETSNVTDMEEMFEYCDVLTTIPQLNTSSVTDLRSAFRRCPKLSDESLNNILAMCIMATNIAANRRNLKYIGLSEEQVERCRGLSNYQAFLDAGWTNGYETIPNKSKNINIENNPLFNDITPITVSDGWRCPMETTFIPKKTDGTSLIDTSNLTSAKGLFHDCALLKEVPSLNIAKVTTTHKMFYGCANLKTIPLLDISNVGNMEGMFTNCTSLRIIPTLNTNNATNIHNMFKGCSALTSIPQLDIPKVWNVNSAFADCTNLTEISMINTEAITDMGSLFVNCVSLVSIPQLVTSSATNMANMFKGCSSLTTIPQLVTSSATNMANMFKDCSSLTTIPLLDTSKVTNMDNIFSGCSSLTTIPELNTSNITEMSMMFYNCSNLTTIPQLDTSNVTTTGYMFDGCSSLTTIPQLDTSKVINMSSMFNDCSNLTTIPQLNTSNVRFMEGMFTNCSKLSDESLNNILIMCKNAKKLSAEEKKFMFDDSVWPYVGIGLSAEQLDHIKATPELKAIYDELIAAGWRD